MAWSYDPALSTDKDKVRYLVGDVDKSVVEHVQNETISAVLAIQPRVGFAAVTVARGIANQYAHKVNVSYGRTSVSGAQLYEHFNGIAAAIEKRASNPFSGKSYTPAVPLVGGVVLADKEALDANTGYEQPDFKKGQNDHPGSTSAIGRFDIDVL